MLLRVAVALSVNKRVSKAVTFVVGVLTRLFWYKPIFPKLEFIEYRTKMEVIGMPIAGSTITLKATFPDKAGNLTELQDVTLKVYAPGKMLIETIIPAMLDVGVYTAEYTIPEKRFGQFDYEFSGAMGDRIVTDRKSFDSHWK